ncbi:MAG: sigma-54-dependent Fis family transcriptional regulator [Deltaproteobacteria bacterium]|nr:MAG: sigma-54-dependent Fis family transcriptional regulator [Deltaproteobacteria bacterium]
MSVDRDLSPPPSERPRFAGLERGDLRILIVEDEANARAALEGILEDEGYPVRSVESAEAALEAIEAEPPDLLLVDMKLPGMSGLDLIARVREQVPEAVNIMMTAYSSVDTAVEAMRRGAEDYLVKPINAEELVLVIERERRHRAVALEAKHLREQAAAREGIRGLVGGSSAMESVYTLIQRAAPARASVLITGESGTGKELVARAIHRLSPRSEGPFVAVNCAALPETLIESELFGYEKGAFTGAAARKAGRFELADGGTLFLDEVGEIPPQVQVKLLRALQERAFERVGGTETIHTDVRVIAATNKDLEALVAEGRYRDDLYYRLNVVTIDMPPLRARRSDIPLLWEHFVQKYSDLEGKPDMSTDPEVMQVLFAYDWPGNVRELENAAEHAVVMNRGERITLEHLPARLIGAKGPAAGGDPLDIRVPGMTLREVERAVILRTYELTDRSTQKTAEALGISVRKIQYRLKEYREAGYLDG